MRSPFGCHCGRLKAKPDPRTLDTCCGFEPFADITQTPLAAPEPPTPWNAIRVPSGDQAGSAAHCVTGVTRSSPEPLASTIQIPGWDWPASRIEKAIRPESGRQAGMEKGGLCVARPGMGTAIAFDPSADAITRSRCPSDMRHEARWVPSGEKYGAASVAGPEMTVLRPFPSASTDRMSSPFAKVMTPGLAKPNGEGSGRGRARPAATATPSRATTSKTMSTIQPNDGALARRAELCIGKSLSKSD